MNNKPILLLIAIFLLVGAIFTLVAAINPSFSFGLSNKFSAKNNTMIAQAQPGTPPSGAPSTTTPSTPTADPSATSSAGQQVERRFGFGDPFAGGPARPRPVGGGPAAQPIYVPVYEMPSVGSSNKSGSNYNYTAPTTPGRNNNNNNNNDDWWNSFGAVNDNNRSKDGVQLALEQRFGWLYDPVSEKLVAIIINENGYSIAEIGATVENWRVSSIDRNVLTLTNRFTNETVKIYAKG